MILGLQWYWWVILLALFVLSLPLKIKFTHWWLSRKNKKGGEDDDD